MIVLPMNSGLDTVELPRKIRGMNDFSDMRRLAREKRDDAVKAARLEYEVS